MADVLHLEDEDRDDADEGFSGAEADRRELEGGMMSPLERLQKYCHSDNIFNRQMVARTVLDALRAVADDASDVESVISVINVLADDPEGSVRSELTEQVPHIAIYCHAHTRLHSVVLDHLLPLVLKYLADNDNQVRKASQTALLVLVEQGLIEETAIEEKVCPAVLMLTEMDKLVVDFHTGAVELMSKMAPLIGRAATEKLFLDCFASLCSEPVFYIRKVCAANFGDFCAVVGRDVTEDILLPCFLELCEDEIWGVRKACAETFMSVSCACSLQTRKQTLAPVFANLLVDRSRWVRMSAFQTLGPFISTFADPSITGEFVISSLEGFEFRLCSNELNETEYTKFVGDERSGSESESEFWNIGDSKDWTGACVEVIDSADEFNTFQYWREPIPDISLDVCGKTNLTENRDVIGTQAGDNASLTCSRPIICRSYPISDHDYHVASDNDVASSERAEIKNTEQAGGVDNTRKEEVKNKLKNLLSKLTDMSPPDVTQSAVSQDIVPQELIDHFVSMTHPSQAHKTDNEIAHHCAYSLPAVAYTLGRENWSLLKEAYDALASDMQWKVRRTVASSIHELAVILGEDLTTKDLVPVFNGFIKDLDEVRIGALRHLADFLKLLRCKERNSYLPRLSEFLLTDNEWNWRFREELAEQLLEAIGLFGSEDARKYLSPIAKSLLVDKVAAVRQTALVLVTALVKHVSSDPCLLRGLLVELAEMFAQSKRWNRRQTFVLLCSQLIQQQVLPEQVFTKDVLPHLLDLSWDPVPNVRLCVARTLSTLVFTQETFSDEHMLMDVLKRLEKDTDRDVRYFASLSQQATPSSTST